MVTTAFSTPSMTTIIGVKGSGVESVNQQYEWLPASIIPKGFKEVCLQNQWDVKSTWENLNNGKPWLRASNDAYIYLNSADGHWWIDKPDGLGVYVAPKNQGGDKTCGAGKDEHDLPPVMGWRSLSPEYNPVPSIELITNSNN